MGRLLTCQEHGGLPESDFFSRVRSKSTCRTSLNMRPSKPRPTPMLSIFTAPMRRRKSKLFPLHQFDGRIRADGSTPFAPEAGRYHFYLAIGCPYSHRIAIIMNLIGLTHAISYSLVDDQRDGRGWAFRPARSAIRSGRTTSHADGHASPPATGKTVHPQSRPSP